MSECKAARSEKSFLVPCVDGRWMLVSVRAMCAAMIDARRTRSRSLRASCRLPLGKLKVWAALSHTMWSVSTHAL